MEIENLTKEKIDNRQEANKEIMKLLLDKIEKCPDIRFGQLLIFLNIIPYDQQAFVEESVDTLNKAKTKID